MVDLKNLINLSLLGVYDEEIKKYIGDQADTTSIHTVAKDSSVRKIYFYTEKAADVTVGTTPAFTIDMTDIDTTIGTMTDLKTTEKTNLVGAINELYDAIDEIDLDVKADKVENAVEGNFAGLDADGNLIDSGKKAADFATAEDLGNVADIEVETESGVKATSAIAAINKLSELIEDAGDAGKVTMEEISSGLDSGILKAYDFYQGVLAEDTPEQKATKKIGRINLAKDLVVTSGEVVVNPDAEHVGTFLKLTIANQDAPVYINVADLAHDYTVEEDAEQIQLVISDDREISATIVDGSVGSDEIAANAVTTGKLAENAVTATANAETGVITSTVLDDVIVGALNDAVSALQEDDLEFATKEDIQKLFEKTTSEPTP